MSMNTLKSVLRHLNKEEKVELSSEKVELALVDDLKKALGEFNDIDKDHAKLMNDYKSLKGSADVLTAQAQRLKNKLSSIKDKYEKAAKELGVNPNDNTMFGIAEANIDFTDRILKELKTFK